MRRLAAVAALALVAALPAAAAVERDAVPGSRAAGVSVRVGFEAGLAGWAGVGGKASVVAPGAVGARAARVAVSRGAASFSLAPGAALVGSTEDGATYVAAASLRSDTPGRRVCLRLREWRSGAVANGRESCTTSTRDWRALPEVRYTAQASGSQLDLYVYESGARAGDSFVVDEVSLATDSGTPTPAPAPTPVPPVPGERRYSASSPLNTPIAAGAAVDARSGTMVAQLGDEVARKGWPIGVSEWTSTIYYADASTPRYDVPLSHYGGEKLLGVPIPDGARASGDGDGGMIVIDRATGCEYDLAKPVRSGAGWSAFFANALPTDGDGIYPFAEGLSASGFASAAGKIFPQELARGSIDHALTFTMQATKAGGPVAPATASDGWSDAAGAIPEGARLQLDPSLDLSSLGLAPWQRTIARALQVYGMYLVDTGGAVGFGAQSSLSTPLAYPWGDVAVAYMPSSLAKYLRVLALPRQQPVVYRFVSNRCARLG